ncbi:unnamed protein product [Protopolystoma xenopodis]|uniref:TRAF-type domain-containing protein n=1 Tax=Protopolystoma xenopodis TaxID=117903 RepID=A0A3S5CVA9_9PLAT|nr:unnamed protein product [Protopolystoma xenopodis]
MTAGEEMTHTESCPQFPIPCPNGCKQQEVPRCMLAEHLENMCTKQELACPFAKHGCKFRGKKRNLTGHAEAETLTHLDLINSTTKQLLVLIEIQVGRLFDA